jgi:FKBP-type peptidyl-prolyl cis-trans isomerase SlyD
MQIGSGTVFSFYYSLKNTEGVELENNRTDEPHAVLFGRRQILAGLEDALAGKQKGETVSVTLPPESAFGVRDDGATARVPIKHLVNKPAKLLPGMMVQVSTKQGLRNATVLKVGKFNVDVDTNHPFAGKSVVFDVEIVDVREATHEERSHGHAHGDGGHHH